MNPLSDENPRIVSLESRVKSLNEGKQCPPFKSMLYDLADCVIAHEDLDEEQQALMEHIEKCHMCRSIYSGAIYFSQTCFEVPTPNVADEIMDGMANTPLRRLRLAVKNCPYVDGKFSDYVVEICKHADVDCRDALRVLGFCSQDHSGLTLLDSCSKESIEAGWNQLEMERETIALALWNSKEEPGSQGDHILQEYSSLETFTEFVSNQAQERVNLSL